MYTLQDSAASGMSLLDFPAPAGRVIAGAFDEAIETNPIPLFMMSAEINRARGIGPAIPKVDAEQQAKMAGVKVKVPDEGITQGALSLLIERRRDDANRQLLFARREGAGAAIGSFAASLAGTLLDPLNVAAGFIPIMGGTRYEALLEKAVGAGSRAGLRVGTGAAEGLVGSVVVEGPTIALRRDLQDDYSLYDSLANIAFGTAASGGIRVVGGAAKDVWMATRRLREIQIQRLQEDAPGLERSMMEDLEQGFARGPGIPDDLRVQFEAARRAGATEEELSRLLVMSAARKEGRAQRVAAAGREAGEAADAQRERFSEAEIERFIKAEERMRAEAALPDDRRLLDAAGIAERKFREMDMAEVRARLEAGQGLILLPGNPREVLQAISPETHAIALKTAVAQAIEGQKIDVEGVVRQDAVFGQDRQGIEVVRSRARSQLEPENMVGADKVASEAATKAVEAGPPKPPKAPEGSAQEAQGERPAGAEAPGTTQAAESAGSGAAGEGPPAKGVVHALALKELEDRGWDLNWPFIPADLFNADFAKLIRDDPGLSAQEKARILSFAPAGAETLERAKMLQRGADEWEAIADEIRAEGLAPTRENVLDVDAVARASSIDEAAVERAAMRHEADDQAFMAAVREIISEADKNAETAGRGAAPEATARSETTPAAKTRTGPRGLDDPEIQATIRSIAQYEAGWAQVGGQLDLARLIKENGRDAVDDWGRPTKLGTVAFTEWIPNAEWWMSRPDKKMNARDYQNAVEKALAGKPLKKAEQRAVDFLVDMANERLGLNAELGERAPPMPAVITQMFVEQGGRRYPVESFVDASEKWAQYRDATGEGARTLGASGAMKIVDQDGKELGRLAYNGRVFPPGEWKSGMKPLYDPHTELSHPSNQFEMPQTEEQAKAGAEAVARLKEGMDADGRYSMPLDAKRMARTIDAEKSPQVQEAEALLAETRQNADQARAEAGSQAPAPSSERARADEYEKAYKAIGDCAPKEGS